MCGRFARYVSDPEIAGEFDVDRFHMDIKPGYNIAPGQDIAIVINEGQNRIVQCRWGFIPSWAKDPSHGKKMINARAESVAVKASFKSSFKKRRCLVIANGFYEWRKEGRARTPVYVHLKSRKTFGFAGLYNTCSSPEGGQICSVTIITTGANSLLQPIHDRMPDIIPKDKEPVWLDPSVQDEEVLLPLLNPYPSEDMEFSEVSAIVNSPGNDSPDCIKPVRTH